MKLNCIFVATMNSMRVKLTFLLLLTLGLAVNTDAQRWKRYRYEYSIGLGATNFLGELGGANQIGTNYFKDLEWSQTRFAFTTGLRYKLSNYFAFKTNLTYGRVSGDDKLTTEEFRSYRNLSFFSDIFEWNINFEGAFQQEQVGHRYRLRKVRGQRGYDPRTEFNGKIIRLQPLGTEGQGLIPTRNKYSLWQMCIPIGVGFKYSMNRSWGLGVEFGIRKTFTDYIDDVSTTYFDFQNYAGYDPLALQINDRSNRRNPERTAAGQQRGDPRDKDAYMFATFSIHYKLKNGRNNLPRF
jgi:hypothetical protein